ncbi:hypothetical protein ACFQ5J_07520 [Lacticaseibacillus baoqingensis]|jgi:hypothetical protein|uniref:Uncharacterized protein n=1 Tax=Lacticaseibacillus baoqingensis TaxID=2486013 RepID=A0ABW4E5A0_9LACO
MIIVWGIVGVLVSVAVTYWAMAGKATQMIARAKKSHKRSWH